MNALLRCECVCVCSHLALCMWGTEDNLRCSSLISTVFGFLFIFFRQSLSLAWNSHKLSWLFSEHQGSSCIHFPSTEITSVHHHHPTFFFLLKKWILGFCFQTKPNEQINKATNKNIEGCLDSQGLSLPSLMYFYTQARLQCHLHKGGLFRLAFLQKTGILFCGEGIKTS